LSEPGCSSPQAQEVCIAGGAPLALDFEQRKVLTTKKKQPERGEFSTIYPPGNGSHIPPNGKLGKSSSQNAMPWGGYVIVPWRVTPFSQ